MKTDELINALAADAGLSPASIGWITLAALIGGIVITAILFFVAVGVRPDFAQAVQTVRFGFKLAAVLTLAVPAIVITVHMGNPCARPGLWGLAFALAPLSLTLAVLLELGVVPEQLWTTRLIGTNWRVCLTVIPMLAMAPLGLILVALRHGAPPDGRLAGAMAGLAAGSVGAFFYATHCTDDSPLFVATWYSIAIGIVVLIGALIGHKVLRW
jgi:hypothetical protein